MGEKYNKVALYFRFLLKSKIKNAQKHPKIEHGTMEKIIAILPKWLKESHRFYHLVGIFFVTLLGTIEAGIGCSLGMEFKDVHHSYGNDGKPFRERNWSAWDWLDILAGLIGGILGQAAQIGLILLILHAVGLLGN